MYIRRSLYTDHDQKINIKLKPICKLKVLSLKKRYCVIYNMYLQVFVGKICACCYTCVRNLQSKCRTAKFELFCTLNYILQITKIFNTYNIQKTILHFQLNSYKQRKSQRCPVCSLRTQTALRGIKAFVITKCHNSMQRCLNL